MTYIDGFVFPVPTADKEKLRAYAETVDVLFKKNGALQVIEAWGDDVPKGKATDFYRAVNAKEDETIMFSWIMWPDKAAREAGNEKVFADMKAMGEDAMEMPFDGKRMIYGGFNTLVDL
ncbi:MAG: DUF1428 domain-containing protein [Maricaulaceae bacterium]